MVSWLRLAWGSSSCWAVIFRLSMCWRKGLSMPHSSRDKLRCLPWGQRGVRSRPMPRFWGCLGLVVGKSLIPTLTLLYSNHHSKLSFLLIFTLSKHPTTTHFSLGFNQFQSVLATISSRNATTKTVSGSNVPKGSPLEWHNFKLNTRSSSRRWKNCSTLLYNNPTLEASQNFTIPSLQICTSAGRYLRNLPKKITRSLISYKAICSPLSMRRNLRGFSTNRLFWLCSKTCRKLSMDNCSRKNCHCTAHMTQI